MAFVDFNWLFVIIKSYVKVSFKERDNSNTTTTTTTTTTTNNNNNNNNNSTNDVIVKSITNAIFYYYLTCHGNKWSCSKEKKKCFLFLN